MDMNNGPGSSYMLAANEKIGQMKQQGQTPEQVHASMLEAVKSGLLPFTVAVQALKQYSDPMQAPPQFPKPGSVVGDLLSQNNQRQTGVAGMPNPAMANAQFAGGITGEQAAPPQGMANGGIVAFSTGDEVPEDPYAAIYGSPVYPYFKPGIEDARAQITAAGDPTTFRKTADTETEAEFTKYGIGNFSDREGRINEREARLAKQEKNAGLDAFIKGAFGMAAAGARPGATFLGAAAEGAGQGFEAYGAGKDKIEAAKQAVEEARDRLSDAKQAVRLGKMSASSKAYDKLQSRYDTANANLRALQVKAGDAAADYAGKQLSADAQERTARIYAGQKNKNEDAFADEINNARRLLSQRRKTLPADNPLVIAAENQLTYWNNERQKAMIASNPTAFGAEFRSRVALTVAEGKDPVIRRAYDNVVATSQRILKEGKTKELEQLLAVQQQELASARAVYNEKYNSGINAPAGPAAVEEVQPVPGTVTRENSRDATDLDE